MESSTKPDLNGVSFYDAHWKVISGYYDNTEGAYDSPLKISHSSNIWGTVVAEQGKENAVDINKSSRVRLIGVFGKGDQVGDQVITIKGGSSDIHIAGKVASTKTSSGVVVDVGNHSDQSRALTRRVTVDLYAQDASPVGVRVGWVLPFTVKLGPGCSYLLWASLKLKAYVLAKLIVRALLGIRNGTKGPSWL